MRFPNLFPVALFAAGLAQAAPAVDYNRDIRPILSEHCFHCHGFDEKARKAKLRLDLSDDAYAAHENGTPITPGHLEKSEAWERITSDDPEDLMPPPKENSKLSAEEKAKLKAWIEAGAKYAPHWAFVAPQKLEMTLAPGESAIDHLIRERLQKEGLKPSPEAGREMLLRRVSLDLTGLPPTAKEVEAFEQDSAPDAYAKVVDRLLQSPHLGERLALDWLDVARYADTNGFSIDGGRHLWLWRDYVINAFNTNKPYDQFLVEQLAGDLLPNHTEEHLIATGFQRNNMVTHEGGTIPAENLTNYNVDRVKTLGEAVLGLTLACAQCHDHKFDPIKQRDYYQLFSYFNTLSDRGLDGDGGVNAGPVTQAHTVLHTGEEDSLKAEIGRVKEELAHPAAEAVAKWAAEQRAVLAKRGQDLELLPVEVLKISTPNRGNGFEVENGRVLHITGAAGLAAYDVSMKLPATDRPITGLRAVFYPDDKMPGGGWGYGPIERRMPKGPVPTPPEKGTFILSAISSSASSVPGDQVNIFKLLSYAGVTADTWQEKFPPADALDLRNENGWSPELEHTGPVRFTATFKQPLSAKATPYLTAQYNFGHGQSMIAARFELFAMTGTDDDSDLPAPVIAALNAQAPDAAEQELIRAEFAAKAPATAAARVQLANLEERLAVITQAFPTMVMDVAEKPRETFILHRGDYSQPTDKVTPGTPAFLPAAPAGTEPNRLGLAKWIVMPENPLTARVAVNRFWQMLFGTGIVRTAADFGAQGEWPSHPELLDWLAVDFREHGWDVKRLLREILMSETYRQDSACSPELMERDPQNRLLARGPRFRLAAEFVRDAALAESGLLVDRLGGPSVNPYTPGDPWREVSHYGSTPATSQTFVQDHGEKLYRRSLYTYWKRTVPPPNLSAFDAPNRETCLAARSTTNTPLQALVLLNDVQYVEAARAFAERILAQSGDDSARIAWAFKTATGRPPKPAESAILGKALVRERDRYSAHPEAAAAYLSAGESPRNPQIPVPEHAAWAQLASTLLNLSESITCN